jgi:hypothetical protein
MATQKNATRPEARIAPVTVAPKSRTMNSQVVLVTPEMAREMLDNRNAAGIHRLSKERVRRYEAEILAGEWAVTHQSIALDGPDWETSRLIDGQHRLFAIINTGRPVELYVTFNAPASSYGKIDQNLVRTAAQTASLELLAHGIETDAPASRLAGMARVILIHGLREKKPSNSRVAEYVRLNYLVLDKYSPLAKAHTAGTGAAFAYAEITGFQGVEGAAQRLTEQIWEEDQKRDPMRALSNSLSNIPGQGDRAQRTRFHTVLSALEFVDRGEGCERLQRYTEMAPRVASSIQKHTSAPADAFEGEQDEAYRDVAHV